MEYLDGFSPEAERLYAADMVYHELTSREQEVLQLISDGFTNNEMAQKLSLSYKALESHRYNIRAKGMVLGSTKEMFFKLIKYGIFEGYISHNLPENSEMKPLSPAETKIFAEFKKGGRHNEIACNLGVSPKTVEIHLDNIYKKLGVRNEYHAIARATALEDA